VRLPESYVATKEDVAVTTRPLFQQLFEDGGSRHTAWIAKNICDAHHILTVRSYLHPIKAQCLCYEGGTVVANLDYVSSAHPGTMWADAWKNGPDIEQNVCDEVPHFWKAVVKLGLNSSKLRVG
jgi:hypothetical protein